MQRVWALFWGYPFSFLGLHSAQCPRTRHATPIGVADDGPSLFEFDFGFQFAEFGGRTGQSRQTPALNPTR